MVQVKQVIAIAASNGGYPVDIFLLLFNGWKHPEDVPISISSESSTLESIPSHR